MGNDTSGGDRTGDGKIRRLSDAVRRVRIAEAERMDAFSDLHESDRARLAMLEEELSGVFGEVPTSDGYFICSVAGSTPPRLWIDPTTHVMIGRDRRTYRFLKDTRLGRAVLIETADLQTMADAVMDYLAERMVERDRALESDFLLSRLRLAAAPSATGEGHRAALPDRARLTGPDAGSGRIVWFLVLFLAGFACGALGLVLYAWFMLP